MSKKNLVKKIIDELIQDGMDFGDLTQSVLLTMDGLEGVSKTTIKRAKKEYKQEKLSNKRDYKEQALKRKIYKYLDRRPRSSLSDLREAMPGVHPAKVSEYHLFWKKKQEKSQQKATEKKSRISPRKLKEMVFNYLDSNNNASVEALYNEFPDAKQSSINSYFAGWKRKQKNTERAIRGGLYDVIFKFLDKKPEATISDIKAAFSDVPVKSIKIYHNLWLKERKTSELNTVSLDDVVQKFIDTSTSKKPRKRGRPRKEPAKEGQQQTKRRGRPPGSAAGRRNAAVIDMAPAIRQKGGADRNTSDAAPTLINRETELSKNEANLIQTMKTTIEAHNMTISELEKEHQLLINKRSKVIKELEAMPSEQILEIRDFIVTYFKGLQST